MSEPIVIDGAAPEVVEVVRHETLVIAESNSPALVVFENAPTAVVVADGDVVTIVDHVTTVVEVAAVGPQGPAGEDASFVVSKVAASTLGGHRMVILNGDNKATYADNTTITHRNLLFGLTLGAADADDEVEIQTSGEVVELSWSWTPQQPIWLGANGLLTQTVPVAPAVFRRIIAFAATATRIVLGFKEPITIS